MTASIVLFGATGYTSGCIAQEMAARGLQPVLAGRNAAELARLVEGLGGLQTVTADVSDAGSVRALIGEGDVQVSTVGPFMRLGEAVLSAAVQVGAIYLDSTGEPPFLRRVFEEFGPLAARSAASLLTAFGNGYAFGLDVLAAGAAEIGLHRMTAAEEP